MFREINSGEYEELIKNLEVNKDLVMKEIENDVRLLCWIAWGIGVFFPDKSPKEMFKYMKNPSLEKLLQRFDKADTELKDYSGRGYILDTLITINDSDLKPTSFLNIENQIDYDKTEIRNRSLVYLCTIQFKIGNYYKSKRFSDSKPVNSIWIFPKTKGFSNRIELHKFEDIFTVDNAETSSPDEEIQKGNIDKLNAYFFFLGIPEKIIFNSKKLSEIAIKNRILLFLLDVLFSLEIPVNKKLKLLKKFYLTGEQTEREVRGMQDVAAQVRSIIRSVGGLTPEEAEELDLKYEKAEALNAQYKLENKKFKDRYEKAEARYENAQERINELEKEINALKKSIDSSQNNR